MTSTKRTNEFDRLHIIVKAMATERPSLNIAVEDLDRCAELGFRSACKALQDARPQVLGATSYDGPGGSTGSSTPPTERLLGLTLDGDPDHDLINGDGTLPDTYKPDRAALDAALTGLARAVSSTDEGKIRYCSHTLRRIVTAWTPRRPSEKTKAEVSKVNAGATECSQTRAILNIHEPAYRTTDLGGMLPEPTPVGRWYYDFARDHGRLPTPLEMRTWASRKDSTRSQLTKQKAGR